jgi:ACS family hexuronate transporter-like MFS transporter
MPRVGIRWRICALLFFASAINYIDRQVIGILKPTLERDFLWTEVDYSDIVFAFQCAYAIGYLIAGRVVDKIGTKRGLALALVIWSLAALGHAQAPLYGKPIGMLLAVVGLKYSASVAGFIAARFMLGLGESGNFPASIKAVTEWFPRSERALATGIFNAGTNVGALVAPLAVPWLTIRFGWQWAFIATGALGFAWLAGWWLVYEHPDRHERLSIAERAHIAGDTAIEGPATAWRDLLPHRQTWAFAIAKFITDPIWWLYLYWIPDFFSKTHGLSLGELGPPLVVIYLIADLGSVGGGWLSSSLLRRGWSTNAARKTTMLVAAVAVVPIAFAPAVRSEWAAVAIIGLAAAAHQGWSANLFTLAPDMFPRQDVGSVVGIGGTAGAIGGMLIAKLTGWILQYTGSYVPVFLIAASGYLVALAILHALVPRLERVK